jgi:hypothetical protein
MTKKDYELIAHVLGKKLIEVKSWSIEAQSLSIAYIEDFITILQLENKEFAKIKFFKFINKMYGTTLSY